MNARTEFALEPTEHSGLRRAALALHAMEYDDQVWLLMQLPADHRPVLKKMLADLATLGLPRDRNLVEDLLRDSSPPRKGASHKRVAEQGLHQLRSAPAADLALLLEHEPPGLVAHAVALLALAVRSPVLDLLSAPKRRRVQEILSSTYAGVPPDGTVEAAPRLTEAVCKEVASRLPSRLRPARTWQGFLSRWRTAALGDLR
jgi:hypothetical protein